MFPELYKNMEELHRLVDPFRLEYEFKRMADVYERAGKELAKITTSLYRIPRPGILGKLARIFRLSYGWVDVKNMLFDLVKK